jgi:dUTP pyrophosphatase
MLNGKEIKKLIQEKNLLDNYIDLDKQVTPNGFDLTAGAVFIFDAFGAVDFSNKERILPACREITPKKNNPEDKFGWWHLDRGAYKIISNETINLPKDLIAIAFSRSSLLRMGAFIQNAVWDAGFKGRSEFLLIVENPYGIKLKQNARILQLIFIKINAVEQGYQGIYKNI